MDDRRRALRGIRAASRSCTESTAASSRVFDCSHCPASAQLALDVILLAAEVAEADGVGVDRVDRGQRVRHPHPSPAGLLAGERLGLGDVAQHGPSTKSIT